MEPEFTSDPWACFDKIYCISIDERADRRISARRQFRLVGLEGRVEFLIVPKHPTDREQGIYESHITCMQKGVAAGARMILIFEDDIIFDRYDRKRWAACVDFLVTDQSWEVFFLGCLVAGSQRTGNEAVLKVKYRCLAHAYVVRCRFAAAMVAQPWRQVPFDAFLRSRSDAAYAAYPAIAFQSDAATDNLRCLTIDRLRRFCGGLKRIQKMNEWYHRHRVAVIGLHVLVCLAILLMIVGYPGRAFP